MNEYYSDQGGGSGAIFKTLAWSRRIQVGFQPNMENADFLLVLIYYVSFHDVAYSDDACRLLLYNLVDDQRQPLFASL